MPGELNVTPELEQWVREIVRDEIRMAATRDQRHGWSPDKMVAAMERIRERRKTMALPADVVDALIEEHRKEFGRGPLIDEPDDA